MDTNEFWQKFIKDTGAKPDLKYNGEYQFGFSENSMTSIISLVLSGNKTAISSSLLSYEIDKTPVPKVNDYYIITDTNDNPVCIVKNIKVTKLAFKDVTWDLAQKEGEDTSMEQWRQSHIEYFEEEADIIGYNFSESMPIVFEEFEVVYKG